MIRFQRELGGNTVNLLHNLAESLVAAWNRKATGIQDRFSLMQPGLSRPITSVTPHGEAEALEKGQDMPGAPLEEKKE